MMKIPFLRKLITNRRGISMVEVVVSLTIIMMITAAAIGLVISSIQFEEKYLNLATALRDSESIAACVRYAEGPEGLNPLLQVLGFDEPTHVLDEDTSTYTYTLVKDDYTITLTVNFDTNEYTISAVDENHDVIY